MIAGVDEVGRGPLAGAVVAAAVILAEPIPGLQDSKILTPKKREMLSEIILEKAVSYAFGRAEVEEIDTLNIHHATLLAMKRAILGLSVKPESVIIDGKFAPVLDDIKCSTMVMGDSLVPAISAASIIAKVLRDREMVALDALYPGYGFADHKGYSTKEHILALQKLGACPIHRRSFSPVKDWFMNSQVSMPQSLTVISAVPDNG